MNTIALQPEPEGDENPKRFRPPGIEECKLHAAKLGLPESEGVKFFLYYGSKGWMVGKSPMKNWHMAMAGWKLRWEEARQPDALRPTASEMFVRGEELKRVEAKMKAISGSYSEHQSWTADDVEKFRALKQRKQMLMKLLGMEL